jgi:CDP-2,3-bis-(O-geranylgeranyl)-sn-glycerol synthase
MIISFFYETLWFFLPAIIANMAPVFARRYQWLPSLATPVDRGRKWGRARILGDHKTWRGFVVGILSGGLVGFLQYLLSPLAFTQDIALIRYDSFIISVAFGSWMGYAALLGDAVGSSIKRQFKITPGKLWMPWDQIDFILGAIALTVIFYPISSVHYGLAILIIGVGSYVVSFIGVKLKVKLSL